MSDHLSQIHECRVNFNFNKFSRNTINNKKIDDLLWYYVKHVDVGCELMFREYDGFLHVRFIYTIYNGDGVIDIAIPVLQGETFNLGDLLEENLNVGILQDEKYNYTKNKLYAFIDRCLNRCVNNDKLQVKEDINNQKYCYEINGLVLKIDNSIRLEFNGEHVEVKMEPNMKLDCQYIINSDLKRLNQTKIKEELQTLLNKCIHCYRDRLLNLAKYVASLVALFVFGYFVLRVNVVDE
jgi:hypothetical protein